MLKTVDQIQAEIFMALVNKRLKNRIKAMIPEIKNFHKNKLPIMTKNIFTIFNITKK